MARNFSGTGDDARATIVVALGSQTSSELTVGWFYPTTLTAGRYYFGAATAWGVRVAPTTSELQLLSNNTTDGLWVTTGAGIVVDKWQFIAVLNSCSNTGPAGAWRVWVGDAETAPIEASVGVTTAPVGNFSSASQFTIGNGASTDTVAFQGDIGWLAMIEAVVGINSPFGIPTTGTITQDMADLVYQRHVVPLWRADHPGMLSMTHSGSNVGAASTATLFDFDGGAGNDPQTMAIAGSVNTNALTYLGPTHTETRAPRQLPIGWPKICPYVRR